jgi:hypothetical protein
MCVVAFVSVHLRLHTRFIILVSTIFTIRCVILLFCCGIFHMHILVTSSSIDSREHYT